MKKTLFVASLFTLALFQISYGQTAATGAPAPAAVEEGTGPMKDIVSTLSGKFIATEFLQVALADGTNIEVKSDAIAPSTGVINKENFIRVFTVVTMQAIYDLIPEGGITKVTYLTTSNGNPDVEVNMLMSKTGMQTVVTSNTSNSGTKRTALTWKDIFK